MGKKGLSSKKEFARLILAQLCGVADYKTKNREYQHVRLEC